MNYLEVKKDGTFCYSIQFQKDFSALAEEIAKLDYAGHKLCVVTDSNVAPLYLTAVKEELSKKFDQVFDFVIPAGEENKTLDNVKKLYEKKLSIRQISRLTGVSKGLVEKWIKG